MRGADAWCSRGGERGLKRFCPGAAILASIRWRGGPGGRIRWSSAKVPATKAEDAVRHDGQRARHAALLGFDTSRDKTSMQEKRPAEQVDYYRRIAAEDLPVSANGRRPGRARAGRVAGIVAAVPGITSSGETLPARRSESPGSRILPVLAGIFGGAGGRTRTDELARALCGTMPACADRLHVRFERARAPRGGAAGFTRLLPLVDFFRAVFAWVTKESARARDHRHALDGPARRSTGRLRTRCVSTN